MSNKLPIIKESDKCFHCREMVIKFLKTKPKIKNISFVEMETDNGDIVRTGDIVFSVCMSEMGFDKPSYFKYEKEFFSSFMINFFGEFLVRENISNFVELSYTVDSQDFIHAISTQIHKKFGIMVQSDMVTFTFHISLLPKILTEDLKSLDW